MVVTFNAATARIQLRTSGVKPSLFVGRDQSGAQVAVCHLTNGFVNPDNIVPAFNAFGEVQVSGSASEVRTHTVNFIQFQKVLNVSLEYSAGEFVSPERILIDAGSPPALRNNLALDSDAGYTPFTNPDPLVLTGGKVTNITGDHPTSKAPIGLIHYSDGRRNMLTSIADSREFWTSFVVLPPGGALQYLAHFHWQVNFAFGVQWEFNGDMQVKWTINNSTFQFDAPVLGPPTAREIVAMLANPQPPQANEAMRYAIQSTVLGGPPNRRDLDF